MLSSFPLSHPHFHPSDTVRERVQKLRNALSTRRRTLAIATSIFNIQPTSTPSSSASPPQAPLSGSAQTARRPSLSISSQSSTPPPPPNAPPVIRTISSASRPLSANFFTSNSPQTARSPNTVDEPAEAWKRFAEGLPKPRGDRESRRGNPLFTKSAGPAITRSYDARSLPA